MKELFAVIAVACLTLLLLPAELAARSKDEANRLWKEGNDLRSHATSYEDVQQAALKYHEALAIFQRLADKKSIGGISHQPGHVYSRLADMKRLWSTTRSLSPYAGN